MKKIVKTASLLTLISLLGLALSLWLFDRDHLVRAWKIFSLTDDLSQGRSYQLGPTGLLVINGKGQGFSLGLGAHVLAPVEEHFSPDQVEKIRILGRDLSVQVLAQEGQEDIELLFPRDPNPADPYQARLEGKELVINFSTDPAGPQPDDQILTVYVPRGQELDLEVHLDNGDLVCRDLPRVWAQSTNGDLDIYGAQDIQARTENGDLTLQYSATNIQARTENGDIIIQAHRAYQAEFYLATENGDLVFQDQVLQSPAKFQTAQPLHTIHLTSESGDIYLEKH